ncbi:vacuolar protein sorting-associated protein 37B-like [Acanthochromis polyacanthus]|uniref:vacuolar protein sorting-associated protein 37B-like n=1 Tax=Acanthochromis polyacanthus TaxID=80966 RepID=UPI002234DA76|nr:vacuolar protein sorting-associated protein 37B-like [Acanthochromis polyacanthus]
MQHAELQQDDGSPAEKHWRRIIMSVQLQFNVCRTRELRELLEDEGKIKRIVRCSEKVQRLRQAAEKTLVSNQKLAKASLSQKPKLRDAKLLLAMKYRELEKLRSIIQAKQEQLAEKYSIHYARWCLQENINHADEEFELLVQRFAEGKAALTDFLDSSLSSRMLHHIRLALLKKLQEMVRHEEKTAQRLDVARCLSEQIHSVYSLTTAVVLPTCCHPPFLLPLGAHVAQCFQRSTFRSEDDEFLLSGANRRGLRWPTRPARLQPLKMQQRRNQQAPQ